MEGCKVLSKDDKSQFSLRELEMATFKWKTFISMKKSPDNLKDLTMTLMIPKTIPNFQEVHLNETESSVTAMKRAKKEVDEQGNERLVFHFTEENFDTRYFPLSVVLEVKRFRQVILIEEMDWTGLQEEFVPDTVKKFLKETSLTDFSTQPVTSLINQIRHDSSDPLEALTRTITLVNKEIVYDKAHGGSTIEKASWTLKNRRGTCDEKAHLLAAILRGLGFPTKVVVGGSIGNDGKWDGHAWNEVFISDQWVPVDATYTPPQIGWVDCGHVKLFDGMDVQEFPSLSYSYRYMPQRDAGTRNSTKLLLESSSSGIIESWKARQSLPFRVSLDAIVKSSPKKHLKPEKCMMSASAIHDLEVADYCLCFKLKANERWNGLMHEILTIVTSKNFGLNQNGESVVSLEKWWRLPEDEFFLPIIIKHDNLESNIIMRTELQVHCSLSDSPLLAIPLVLTYHDQSSHELKIQDL